MHKKINFYDNKSTKCGIIKSIRIHRGVALMDLLIQAREKIDKIDREMARLFCERMDAVKCVVQYKKQSGKGVLDKTREEAVVNKNLKLLNNAEYAEFYEDFIRHNMSISRDMQMRILAKDTVFYQGVEGAFSHIAAQGLFKHAQLTPCPTWAQVVQAVKDGTAEYGVLPFENSHAGDVSEVLDLCYKNTDIYVDCVYDLQVSQNLLCVPGAKIGDIKKVVSHPQALTQSAKLINTLGFEMQSLANTAMAAKHVAQNADKSVAAIASLQTAEIYGLEVLIKDVNESRDNTTRFIVIKKGEVSEESYFKTSEKDMSSQLGENGEVADKKHDLSADKGRFSLLFTVSHEAGSLSKVIETIAKHGFNMECIKSRPIPQVSWEYYFYTELVGAPNAQLFAELKNICSTLRLLGVYTKGN